METLSTGLRTTARSLARTPPFMHLCNCDSARLDLGGCSMRWLQSVVIGLLPVVVSVHFFGCASSGSYRVSPLKPIVVDSSLCSPMSFKKLVFRVPAGARIGAHHDGILRIEKYDHYWQSGLATGSEEFRVIASEVLRSNGYRILGGDDLLFGSDESSKADYQLGGTVSQLSYDTYGALAGGFSRSSMTVQWQLYDALQKSVVYERTTTGVSEADESSIVSMHGAFRRALMSLLMDSTFARTVQSSPRDAWEARSTDSVSLKLTRCLHPDSLTLPRDLEDALSCVVLVKAGASIGSGVVISKDGFALTAAHVVSDLDQVVVKFQSGLEFDADVIRTDVAQDVALIKLPGSGHSCLYLREFDDVSIGEEVFAVGAPAGEEFAFSVSKGIVSGIRELNGFSYLQTDASLNPGNSGGPLLDIYGNIVGVVSWKIVARGFEGLSFGVPPNAITRRLAIEVE